MAAFSYQHHQSLFLDHAYLPSNSVHMGPASDQPGYLINAASSFFPCYYSPDVITEISTNDVRAYESSSSLDTATKVTSGDHPKQMRHSSVPVDEQIQLSEEVQTRHNSMDKKRKNSSNEGRRRRQKKCKNGLEEAETQVSKSDESEERQQAPTGYIHVRARRGQATDSHSLAERVRREKISERMKLLQDLVPGCDKVIGKALMLDEIINYVQSLQNQVEFLSMKLASVNPTLYNFGLDLDDYVVQTQKLEGMIPPVPSVQQSGHIQPTAFVETTDNFPMVDTSVPFLLHGQGPSAFNQEHHHQQSFAMHVDQRNERLLHPFQIDTNMCSFQ